MMYHKAMLFKDHEIADKILLESKPGEIKRLGRKVKNFDHMQWDEEKLQIVEDGNFWKFTQHKSGEMKERLLATGQRELVEVSLCGSPLE